MWRFRAIGNIKNKENRQKLGAPFKEGQSAEPGTKPVKRELLSFPRRKDIAFRFLFASIRKVRLRSFSNKYGNKRRYESPSAPSTPYDTGYL